MIQHLDKQSLHHECLQIIRQKIAETQSIILEAGESAQADTKSTAGDKHDTARAMVHLEQEKYAALLAQQRSAENILLRINPNKVCTIASLGSIVYTSMGLFYISAPIGKCSVDGQEVFVLSATSPLAIALQGKCKGDSYIMAGKQHTIIDIS